ncbi:odorant receptor 46a-like [Diorhabda sublineata]|uniref:odorant receptor 46a-like n=1 Tax=Diorhabda sublineata TaxID=1163346 RepID=UPI0024E0EDC5|nr:odorant receptor 46a-like [Diorhabda sublineata]
MFNIFGIWMDDKCIANSMVLTMIYGVSVIVLFIITPQFCHFIYMYKARDNVIAFADEFYVSMSSLMIVCKDFCLIKHKKKIKGLMKSMDSEIFRPESPEQYKRIFEVMGKYKKLFWLISFVNVSFCVCVIINPLFDTNKTDTKYVLPLVDCYPFAVNESPVYQIMYVYQIFVCFYLMMHNYPFDVFIVDLLGFCIAECDVLCEQIDNLKLEKSPSSYDRKLTTCIKHHKAISRFFQDVERIFSFPILQQYFCNLISSCTTMFRLSIAEPMSVDFYKTLSYQSCLLLQMFLYCWTASSLTEKSQKIPVLAYDSYRLDVKKSTQSNLKLFIAKSQHPLLLKTLLFSLSMEQYLQLIRNSFSYYTVLTSLNEDS